MNVVSGQRILHFSLTSGARVLDRYTVQRGLGIGGFGEVYFAISDAGKEVAIKRIDRNLNVELRGISHCLNLKHPHLISLHDVCQDAEGTWWLVMEYIAGGNLREALDRCPGGLSDAEVRRWFLGAADGLQHLHDHGVVHRDLKPGNLFDDGGIVKIGDYGLSKSITQSRRGAQTEAVGTVHYMAPEIGRGQYGHEIDLYALGVILFEMLTDRLPHDGDTTQEIMLKHLSAQPDLSQIAPPYRQLIETALHKDPRQRWQSAAQMADALRQPGAAPAVQTPAAPPAAVSVSTAPPREVPLSPSPAAERGGSPPSGGAEASPFGGAVTAGSAVGGPRFFQLPPIVKLLVFVLVALLLVRTGRFLLPAVMLVSLVYVPLYVAWQLHRNRRQAAAARAADRDASVAQAAHTAAGAMRTEPPRKAVSIGPPANQRRRWPGGGRAPRPLSRKAWRQWQRGRIAGKPPSTQLAELAGSWVAAAIVVAFCSVLMAVAGLHNGPYAASHIAGYVWVAALAFLATVCLLAIGKLWERYAGSVPLTGLPPATADTANSPPPPAPPSGRLVLLGLGGGLGLIGYGLHQFLMLPIEPQAVHDWLGEPWQRAFYDAQSHPRPAAWVLHFALLLAAVRWWRLTDPLRPRRLRLTAVAWVLLVAWAIQWLVPIAQPWGWLTAGTIAAATQIAAAWETDDGFETAQQTQRVA